MFIFKARQNIVLCCGDLCNLAVRKIKFERIDYFIDVLMKEEPQQ